MTGTVEDSLLVRWRLFVPDCPYNAPFGIPTFWRAHPELGSPLEHERDLGGGVKVQSFAGGTVRWTPDVGAELVTE